MTRRPRLRATYVDEVIVTETGTLLQQTTILLEDADTGQADRVLIPVLTLLRPDDEDSEDRRRWTSRDW